MVSRAHVFIEGRVQRVFFRKNTRRNALEKNLTGFVRNLSDGRVEAVFEGDEEKIEEMIEFCKRGPRFAKVKNVKVIREPFKNEFDGFEILY